MVSQSIAQTGWNWNPVVLKLQGWLKPGKEMEMASVGAYSAGVE